MEISFSHSETLTCRQCSRKFDGAIWLIVDTTERPDLLERLRKGTLHDLVCPNCKVVTQVDAPLLLYRPNETLPLIFSPAQKTTAEQSYEQETILLGVLCKRLGNSWKDDWLEHGPLGVARSQLSEVLSNHSAIGVSQMEEAAHRVNGGPDTPPEFVNTVKQAKAAKKRYQSTGDRAAQEEAITAWLRILKHPLFRMAPALFQLSMLSEAGKVLRQRYLATDNPDVLNNFGNAMSDRYERAGELEDLVIAIDAYETAVAHTLADSPDLHRYLGNLGLGLRSRYVHMGLLEDLEYAIRVYRSAVEHAPTDAVNLPGILSNLGNSLRDRYRHCGRREDLEQAIDSHKAAMERSLGNSAYLPGILSNLADCQIDRYRHTGQSEDLEGAIHNYQLAVQLAPINSSQLPIIFSSLGEGLRIRYGQMGQLEDLEHAIRAFEDAVRRDLSGSSDFYHHLGHLGVGLLVRYGRTAQLEDLEQAIETFRKAVQYTPAGSPDLSGILNNLSEGLRIRYERKKRREDLEQAVEASQKAVQYTPQDSPELPDRLSSLGTILNIRYMYSGDPEDLEHAVATCQEAVRQTPANGPNLPNLLTKLGNSLSNHYQRTGLLEDLEQAITVFQDAVHRASVDSPDLPSLLGNLGNGLADRYKRTGQPEDLNKAIETYEEACRKGLSFAPDVALVYARTWSNWATERTMWSEAARAYTYGVQAIEQLYRVQLLRANQESWLSETYGFHANAAYAMAQAGLLHEAVLTLEQGRARGLNEILARDRADLEQVRQVDKETYLRYQQAAERLQYLERVERGSTAPGVADWTDTTATSPADQIRQAREDLEQAIAHIRLVPGYEGFLTVPTYQDISQATQVGMSIVYLSMTRVGSMALLVHTASNSPEVIWQGGFTAGKLNDLLVKRDGATVVGGYLPGQLSNQQWLDKSLTKALPLLGRELLAPIAMRLRDLSIRKICLIPMGLLGLLPLHAACYKLNDRETTLLDEFDVAYAPSARVLAAVCHEAQLRQNRSTSSHLVAVGNPLPNLEVGTWAQIELQQIIPVLDHMLNTIIPNSQAALPSEDREQVQSLVPLYEQTLQHLQMLCEVPVSELLHAGNTLSRAAVLFARLPDLHSTIIATLGQLATRIPASLTYGRTEVECIQSLLSGDAIALYEQEASLEALWSALPRATIAHFSCHGNFNIVEPLDSALMLARETRLTLRDLFNAGPQRLTHLRLVFLSACQTAVTDFQRVPDEVVGLPSGFLQIGVPSVVGTLWSVDDLSTSLLVIRFYELLLYGDPRTDLVPQQPAQALRLAQNWLRGLTNKNLLDYLQDRGKAQHLSPKLVAEMLPALRQVVRKRQGDEHPYADPYHWAAFVYYGVV